MKRLPQAPQVSPRNSNPEVARTTAAFDFTQYMRRLCDDLVSRLKPLSHVDMSRVAVSFAQTRKAGKYGMHASLTPLRFAGGRSEVVRRGRKWQIQRLMAADGREMLYILNFYLPRFLDLPFEEKLGTVVHELWHIGPQFDGDMRRYGGRFFAHSASQRQYDAHVAALARRWLALNPPESLYAALRFDFHELVARYGQVCGRKIPAPKIIAVP